MKRLFRLMANNMGVVGELLGFLWERKLWWLMPMVIVLLVFWFTMGICIGVRYRTIYLHHLLIIKGCSRISSTRILHRLSTA